MEKIVHIENSIWGGLATVLFVLALVIFAVWLHRGSARGGGRMDQTPYPIRKMRRFWRWHVAIFVLASFATLAVLFWAGVRDLRGFDWCWGVPFAVGMLLYMHLYRFVRCPGCSRRLRARVDEKSGASHFLYDCPHCRVTWDSQYYVYPD
jgi:hypothetical protein